MKVSLNWVKQFTDVDVSTEELVKLATERLGGIESVTDLGKHYEGIVVAKVVSCEQHPNADKLSLCKIDDGGAAKDVERDEDGYVQVVCGAPNVREGLTVAWVPPGSTVPASYGEKELFVLEARDLRGQVSNGMLASPRELGINDNHEGLLELEDVKPGTPFKERYDLDDTILEIENKMFTHRPDGFGQLGVAREIAGIQHKAFTSPGWYLSPQPQSSTDVETVSVSVEDASLCPRYMAVVLENITVKPSPIWLQSHLKRVGIRPINNVVDITNYMMMLTAQPLHAFDFDKIAKNDKAEIIVRRPKEGKEFTLLDGKGLTPHKDAVLICNHEKPIALGGVMGGGNSEVEETTTKIVLECATFDMYNIRTTSMEHGLFTDAVTRFNKGQPARQLPAVLWKTVAMFEELAGAKVVGKPADSNPNPKQNQPVTVASEFINERLGSSFTTEEISKLLTNVEFKVEISDTVIPDSDRESSQELDSPIKSENDTLVVRPPFWRTDIEIKEDIVEEVGRLHGFNQLPLALPKRSIAPVTPDPKRALQSQIRHSLSRAGANEVLTYSFVHGNLLKKVGQDSKHAYALRNALSPDLQYYRLGLTAGLLEKVHPNLKAGFDEFALFELGKVHYKGEMDENEPNVPNEDNHLALVIAYDDKNNPGGAAYFQARKYLEQIAPELMDWLTPLHEFDLGTDEWGEQLTAPYEPTRSAVIVKEGQIWGVLGEFKPAVQKALKLPKLVAGFEVQLDIVSEKHVNYRPLSRYPSTEQDVTLKVKADLPFRKLDTLLREQFAATEYDWHIQPLSIFQKDGENTKNVSFRFTLTHHERTLTTEEVTKLVEDISWHAHEKLGAQQV